MQGQHLTLRKYRWSRTYESAEEELFDILRSRNITAERWHAEEHQEFAVHHHAQDKQLFCAEGSMVLTVHHQDGTGKAYSLQPGDALDLPAGTRHSVVAGMTGAVCYESPAPADNPPLTD